MIHLLKQLLSKKPDPTATWGHATDSPPALDFQTISFGPITFGDPLSKAASFGRPESVEQHTATQTLEFILELTK